MRIKQILAKAIKMKIPSTKEELIHHFETKSRFSTPMVKGMIAIVIVMYLVQFFIQ